MTLLVVAIAIAAAFMGAKAIHIAVWIVLGVSITRGFKQGYTEKHTSRGKHTKTAPAGLDTYS